MTTGVRTGSGLELDLDLDAAGAAAAAALDTARRLGAEHADFRCSAIARLDDRVRDGRLEGSERSTDRGFGVRVLLDGTWGFAAGIQPGADEAARVAGLACAAARLARPLRGTPVELADEPVYPDGVWCSPYEIDPFDVPAAERVARLQDWLDRLGTAGGADHTAARLHGAREDTYYADSRGTRTRQRRIWLHPQVQALRLDREAGGFTTMRTLGPPAARGFEYLDGAGWDFTGELDRFPELLAEQAGAERVRPGQYDLVIDPTNLWLTIHESVGHATELDRALGWEAAYAGTSFATVDRLGNLQYGSPAMSVVADRTTPHGLATIGFDDEGVAAQSWDLVRDGRLVGYQADRQTAGRIGLSRSNGCAYADAPGHVPVQRMANVSLQAAPGGPDTEDLISGVRDGIYVVGDKSWSIDMQRFNFQFTGQRFYRIRNGRLAGALRDVAYQGTTIDFWNSLVAVGGPQTFLLSGASNCGKAQPGQIAGVSHGCPSALFRGVRVLNTDEEGGR